MLLSPVGRKSEPQMKRAKTKIEPPRRQERQEDQLGLWRIEAVGMGQFARKFGSVIPIAVGIYEESMKKMDLRFREVDLLRLTDCV